MSAATSKSRPSRGQRFRAVARDLLPLATAEAVSIALVTVWLLVRSGAGGRDLPDLDAQLAAAALLAVPPAWLAWYASGISSGTSSGQRSAGMRVQGSSVRRSLRLVLHPLAVPLWTWLALLALAAGLPYLAIPLLLATVLVALGGLVSVARWALAPGRPGLHDVLAGTRLVVLEEPGA
jgi:hypothetical protein